MSYHGPKAKVARALSHSVSPKTDKVLDRRNFPPGQHGLGRKKSASVYKQQLVEKQRLRFTYNISEQDMRKAFERASKFHGSTGDGLLITLESRLDAVIYRMGFARTMFAARQYVAHGHFMVNGRRSFIPSRQIKAGDVITMRERSKTHPQIVEAIGGAAPAPAYLSVTKEKMEGKYVSQPQRDQIPVKVNEQLVVEYYSR